MEVYVGEAIAAVQTRAYADAIEQFQKLAWNPKLPVQQRQAVQDLIFGLRSLAVCQWR